MNILHAFGFGSTGAVWRIPLTILLIAAPLDGAARPSLAFHSLGGSQGELRAAGTDLDTFVIQVSEDLQSWDLLSEIAGGANEFTLPIHLGPSSRFFRLARLGRPEDFALKVALETDRTSSGRIDREGGVIEAIDVAGNRLRLTLPPDALLSPEIITLTPISAIENGSFTGFLAGVDLGPDGLRLLRPATLEIIPADAFDPFQYSGFAYEGQGRNPHILPIQRNEVSLDFTLMRFSGYCAAEGSGEELQSRFPPPRCTREWAYQEISAIVEAAARRAQHHPDGEVDYSAEEIAAMEAILESWYLGTVLPWAEQAVSDEAILRHATRELLEWDVAHQLLGLDDDGGSYDDTAAATLLAEGYLNAIENASDRCVAGRNPLESQLILGYAAEYQMLFDHEADAADLAMELVRDCVQFELVFHTQLLQDFSPDNDIRNEVEFLAVDVKLVPDESMLVLEGSGLLNYKHFKHDDRNCHWEPGSWFTSSAQLEDSWFEATMTLGLNYTPSPPQPGDPDPCAFVPPLEPDENSLIHLYLDIGEPREIVTWECYDSDNALVSSGVEDLFPIGRTLFWWANFERYQPALGDFYYTIDNITPGAVVFAEKRVEREMEIFFAPLHEETVLTLFHTPSAQP